MLARVLLGSRVRVSVHVLQGSLRTFQYVVRTFGLLLIVLTQGTTMLMSDAQLAPITKSAHSKEHQ